MSNLFAVMLFYAVDALAMIVVVGVVIGVMVGVVIGAGRMKDRNIIRV
jgi:hypothetical protein